MLHRIIKTLVNLYKNREIKLITKTINMGRNSHIEYPSIVEGGELISLGNNTQILSNSRLQAYPDVLSHPGSVSIGDDCYICYRFCILAGGNVSIGNNVVVASDVSIVSFNHGTNPESMIPYKDQSLEVATITVEDNCWIGNNVIITAGVTIGHDSVIGGGSVVTKSIPPYSIAAGNPAVVIKSYSLEEHKWIIVEH